MVLREHGTELPRETFEALVFDWEGTAVPDRRADAKAPRDRIEALCAAGVHVFVVSGTDVKSLHRQLAARPSGRGRLHLCADLGSEVFEVTDAGPALAYRRTATEEEDRALDRAAATTVERLGELGLEGAVVSGRLNRRRIGLPPDPAWARPERADPALVARAVSARLAPAGIAGLAEVGAIAAEGARQAGLFDPRITSGVTHVEIGLTDKSDSAGWAASWLAERGVTGGLVLIGGDELGPSAGVAGGDSLMMVEALARATVVSVGVEPGGVPDGVVHLGGGPARLLQLLDAQLARRSDHRVPQIDPDPAWLLPLPAGHGRERVAGSLGALANGRAGVRGTREEDGSGTSALFLVGGVYADGGRLLHGPVWTGLELSGTHRHHAGRRMVDLRTGTLVRLDGEGTGLRSIRFVSAASPHAMALRAEAPVSHLEPGDPLLAPPDCRDFERELRGGVWLATTGSAGSGIAVAARDRTTTPSGLRVVERLAAWATDPPGGDHREEARSRLVHADALGFDALLADHREVWARRWADAEVVIEGDTGAVEDQLAARFAVFHLLAAAADAGEAAVGARGLTGDAYAGHVFWDADVFVLPALAAILPAAARAMLEYRTRRLPAARAAARARGLAGARFPWESAGDGGDVTPSEVRGRHGDLVPIATGGHEEHIVADVAWAAARYAAWTGDAAFLDRAGRDLLVETARYWAGRVRLDPEGRGHLYGVMGPDEYHEVVDDDAYTNVMARWNLRTGAAILARSGGDAEVAAWRELADSLVDGWSPETGIYEQFAGYFDLEPLLMSEVAPPPVAVDLLLGPTRVAGSQLLKQADVLMLHHLVPEETVAGSLAPCLAYYEPRTAHGSSLSPAIHASLLARAGEPDRALELFRLAARLDLDDLTGTTAGGLHLATMGGVWQALAYGFLGLRAEQDTLAVDPCLPGAWSVLGLRFRFRGGRFGVRAEHDRVTVTCDTPLSVRFGEGSALRCEPPGCSVAIDPIPVNRSRHEHHPRRP
ncbi:MAG TPA: glycosyl hydrolase family 65 protein [Acidimicrobiales bacterium]|nr:glycosyl hydrolase family 65 protein [Acidimicrobiales bacterium]